MHKWITHNKTRKKVVMWTLKYFIWKWMWEWRRKYRRDKQKKQQLRDEWMNLPGSPLVPWGPALAGWAVPPNPAMDLYNHSHHGESPQPDYTHTCCKKTVRNQASNSKSWCTSISILKFHSHHAINVTNQQRAPSTCSCTEEWGDRRTDTSCWTIPIDNTVSEKWRMNT